MSIRRALFALATLGYGLAGQAASPSIRPGLWENTSQMQGAEGAATARLQQQMANLPPAQRQQMQAMLAQQGLRLDAQGITARACITAEMAQRAQLPTQTEGKCTTTITEQTANSLKFSFVCTDPASTGSGRYLFTGDTAYSSEMQVSVSRAGKSHSSTIKGSARWLQADCAGIKPLARPAQR